MSWGQPDKPRIHVSNEKKNNSHSQGHHRHHPFPWSVGFSWGHESYTRNAMQERIVMFKNLAKNKIKQPFCILLWFITLQKKQATTTLYGYNLPALKLTGPRTSSEMPGPKRKGESLSTIHFQIFFQVRTVSLAGAQPPTNCSFARHLVGNMAILCSFAHH